METKQTYIGELPLAEVIKIQEALKPLGYVIEGYKKECHPKEIILRLSYIQNYTFVELEI